MFLYYWGKRMNGAVLITGASTGIGYELAHLFGRDKRKLVLVARNRNKLDDVAKELVEKYSIDVITFPVDLSEPGAPVSLYEFTKSNNFFVETLINNAGFGIKGKVADIPIDEELGMIQVNISSLVELTKRFLPDMLKAKKGQILNVASTAAFQPGPYMSGYYASKAFVLHYSEGLAEELKNSGVTVTALCPGPTITSFQLRANMENTALFKGPFTMTAGDVARDGYNAIKRGKVVYVSGFVNFLLTQSVRVSFRALTRKISGFLNGGGK